MEEMLFKCVSCGHIGKPLKKKKGSSWIELLLWICVLLPGLCYSIWRLSSKYIACEICKSATLQPIEAAKVEKLFHK